MIRITCARSLSPSLGSSGTERSRLESGRDGAHKDSALTRSRLELGRDGAHKDSALTRSRLEAGRTAPKAVARQSDLQEEPMRAAMCRARRMLVAHKDSARCIGARMESGPEDRVEAQIDSALHWGTPGVGPGGQSENYSARTRLESGRDIFTGNIVHFRGRQCKVQTTQGQH